MWLFAVYGSFADGFSLGGLLQRGTSGSTPVGGLGTGLVWGRSDCFRRKRRIESVSMGRFADTVGGFFMGLLQSGDSQIVALSGVVHHPESVFLRIGHYLADVRYLSVSWQCGDIVTTGCVDESVVSGAGGLAGLFCGLERCAEKDRGDAYLQLYLPESAGYAGRFHADFRGSTDVHFGSGGSLYFVRGVLGRKEKWSVMLLERQV